MREKMLLRGLVIGLGVAIALTAALPRAFASAARDEDFGAWNLYEAEVKWRDAWKFRLGEETRFREAGGLHYFETRAGAHHQTRPWLALGSEYVQIRSARFSRNKNIWTWESRPRIYATPSYKLKGWLFEDRSMMEFRFKQKAENTMRYRNQFGLTAPWQWTSWKFQPYTTNELFIETNRNGLVEDRWISGFRFQPAKHLKCSIYYLRQSQKNNGGGWKDSNILGTSIRVAF